MTITKKQLKAFNPCKEGWKWYLAHPITDLRELMTALADDGNAEWAWWIATKLMTKAECVEFAIFAAELVLPIWEARYPDDKRSREAIQAARAWLADPCEGNRMSAYSAYSAAYAYAAAAFSADADAAADAAAYAYAYAAAAYAADAAAYVAYAAYAAAYAAANAAAYAVAAYTVAAYSTAAADHAVNASGSCIVQLRDEAIRILEGK